MNNYFYGTGIIQKIENKEATSNTGQFSKIRINLKGDDALTTIVVNKENVLKEIKTLKVNDQINVKGFLKSRNYIKDNVTQYSTEIYALDISPFDDELKNPFLNKNNDQNNQLEFKKIIKDSLSEILNELDLKELSEYLKDRQADKNSDQEENISTINLSEEILNLKKEMNLQNENDDKNYTVTKDEGETEEETIVDEGDLLIEEE